MCRDTRILRTIANCAHGLLSQDQKALHAVADRIAERHKENEQLQSLLISSSSALAQLKSNLDDLST